MQTTSVSGSTTNDAGATTATAAETKGVCCVVSFSMGWRKDMEVDRKEEETHLLARNSADAPGNIWTILADEDSKILQGCAAFVDSSTASKWVTNALISSPLLILDYATLMAPVMPYVAQGTPSRVTLPPLPLPSQSNVKRRSGSGGCALEPLSSFNIRPECKNVLAGIAPDPPAFEKVMDAILPELCHVKDGSTEENIVNEFWPSTEWASKLISVDHGRCHHLIPDASSFFPSTVARYCYASTTASAHITPANFTLGTQNSKISTTSILPTSTTTSKTPSSMGSNSEDTITEQQRLQFFQALGINANKLLINACCSGVSMARPEMITRVKYELLVQWLRDRYATLFSGDAYRRIALRAMLFSTQRYLRLVKHSGLEALKRKAGPNAVPNTPMVVFQARIGTKHPGLHPTLHVTMLNYFPQDGTWQWLRPAAEPVTQQVRITFVLVLDGVDTGRVTAELAEGESNTHSNQPIINTTTTAWKNKVVDATTGEVITFPDSAPVW